MYKIQITLTYIASLYLYKRIQSKEVHYFILVKGYFVVQTHDLIDTRQQFLLQCQCSLSSIPTKKNKKNKRKKKNTYKGYINYHLSEIILLSSIHMVNSIHNMQ